MAAEEEAALYGDDLPPPPSDAADAAEAALPAAPPGQPVASALEDSVLAVLREEAQRETEARRLEAQRQETRRAEAEGQMQTQPDLGIEAAVAATLAAAAHPDPEPDPEPEPPDAPPDAEAATPPPLSATRRRLAMLKGEDPDAPPPEPARPAARRDLLPDVEEINSTLQPGDGADGGPDVDALPDLTKGSSFRTGFLLALFVLGVAAVIYLAAPSIVASVPALEGPMTAYVGFVDALRLWLNTLMSSASDVLNPGSGG